MTSILDTELSHDAFLGGRVHLWQPKRGYRAGIDPVLLAAATPARGGDSVLELGCGSGAAALCLAARVPGVTVTGAELQADYAALARRSAEESGLPVEIVTADLRALPDALRQQSFDHVICNPPYFERTRGTGAEDRGRDAGRGGETPLADWIEVAARRLAPRGTLTLIQRIDRLPEVLAAAAGRLGSPVLRPIAGRRAKPPHLFLFQARKGGRAGFVLAPALILHTGDRHDADRESYRPEVSAVLRNAADLPLIP